MKKNDFIMAGVVLAISCIFFLLGSAGALHSQGGMVGVYRENEKLASYPLSENRRESFPAPDGGSNVLMIEDGEVYMEEADCPDRLCVKQGRISGTGQAIVCLPHRLVVVIEEGEEPALDAVTG